MKCVSKKIVPAAIAIALALVSFFILSRYAASPDYHTKQFEVLDGKRTTVLELTAASAAASTAVSLIPGDTATPIADKLADLSSKFLIVLCALFLQKYLLTITGCIAFRFIIPAACILFAINCFWEHTSWKKLASKLMLFGLAIYLVVPASLWISQMVEDTYSASITSTVESAQQTTNDIEDNTQTDSNGVISWIISKVGNGIADITAKVHNVLNNFIETLAVFLVTTCLLPILTMLAFVWLTKIILGLEIPDVLSLNSPVQRKNPLHTKSEINE